MQLAYDLKLVSKDSLWQGGPRERGNSDYTTDEMCAEEK